MRSVHPWRTNDQPCTSISVFSVLGKVRSAIGSAQLLMSQKFLQFRELCEENLVSVLQSDEDIVASTFHNVHGFYKMH